MNQRRRADPIRACLTIHTNAGVDRRSWDDPQRPLEVVVNEDSDLTTHAPLSVDGLEVAAKHRKSGIDDVYRQHRHRGLRRTDSTEPERLESAIYAHAPINPARGRIQPHPALTIAPCGLPFLTRHLHRRQRRATDCETHDIASAVVLLDIKR